MEATAMTAETPESTELNDRIVDALREIYDPEIPVNIYDLGLIYDVRIHVDGAMNDTWCPCQRGIADCSTHSRSWCNSTAYRVSANSTLPCCSQSHTSVCSA